MSFVSENLMGKLFSKRKKSAGPRSSTKPVNEDMRNTDHLGGDSVGQGPALKSDIALIHGDAVASVSSVKPGSCVSGSKDQMVILYDYDKRKILEQWTGHTSAVTKVTYGRSIDAVFSSSRDKLIKLWKPGRTASQQDFRGHALVVTAIDLSQDNKTLCSGSRDNTVKLWDVETAACLKSNSIPQNLVTDVKFVPNSSFVVQTGEDKEVRVFDTRSLNPVFSFPKKQYLQMCCDISADGNFIVSSSNGFSGNGCEATLWDLRSRKLHLEYRGHIEAVEACLFLPGTERPLVATASRDCSVKIWNMLSGACETECYLSGSGPLTSLTAYSDGSILVGSFSQGVHLLKLQGNYLTKAFHY
ncbi:WD repeat-containing protein 31 [Aplysia californica]|uniref:WD repeat-containing protein 31 n=1 Tax=Aplysia californica TaxID=6500 RepID=A0ABM1ABM3_APLCA|nr:WD repeat-containing protein 31 [Aplysia californica]